MTVKCELETGVTMLCPLGSLNSASFTTVSHLSLHLIITIDFPDFEINLPYGCSWNDALVMLKNLQYFRLHLELDLKYDVRPSSFGAPWSDIPGLLGDSRLLPHLKEAHFLIEDVVRNGESERREVPAFLDMVATHVHPRWYLPLKCRQDEDQLFSFSYEARANYDKVSSYPTCLGPF